MPHNIFQERRIIKKKRTRLNGGKEKKRHEGERDGSLSFRFSGSHGASYCFRPRELRTQSKVGRESFFFFVPLLHCVISTSTTLLFLPFSILDVCFIGDVRLNRKGHARLMEQERTRRITSAVTRLNSCVTQ